MTKQLYGNNRRRREGKRSQRWIVHRIKWWLLTQKPGRRESGSLVVYFGIR